MSDVRHLIRDDRGASTVEIALALPVLITFIYGIFICGLMFEANAGMQHALGEGARLATIFPTPSNTAIADRMTAKVFGAGNGNFSSTVVDGAGGSGCNNNATGTSYKTLRVTFTMPVSFLFFNAPNLSLTRCKTAYVAT